MGRFIGCHYTPRFEGGICFFTLLLFGLGIDFDLIVSQLFVRFTRNPFLLRLKTFRWSAPREFSFPRYVALSMHEITRFPRTTNSSVRKLFALQDVLFGALK